MNIEQVAIGILVFIGFSIVAYLGVVTFLWLTLRILERKLDREGQP